MGKQVQRIFTDDFKKEAVRLTETSGRTVAQVVDDLGDRIVEPYPLETPTSGGRSIIRAA